MRIIIEGGREGVPPPLRSLSLLLPSPKSSV